MTFHTPLTESTHRKLTKFASDVVARVEAEALDASTTRAYVRINNRQNVTIVPAVTTLQSRKRVTIIEATGRSAAARIDRNSFSCQMRTQWLARKCSEVLALVYEK
jgi:hypothetical protein